MGTSMHAPAARGPFRRLLAALAQRCSPFSAAHLPARAPRDAAHWEPDADARPLPELTLPSLAPTAVMPVADAHRMTAPAPR
jgi:hypothetical protein